MENDTIKVNKLNSNENAGSTNITQTDRQTHTQTHSSSKRQSKAKQRSAERRKQMGQRNILHKHSKGKGKNELIKFLNTN